MDFRTARQSWTSVSLSAMLWSEPPDFHFFFSVIEASARVFSLSYVPSLCTFYFESGSLTMSPSCPAPTSASQSAGKPVVCSLLISLCFHGHG